MPNETRPRREPTGTPRLRSKVVGAASSAATPADADGQDAPKPVAPAPVATPRPERDGIGIAVRERLSLRERSQAVATPQPTAPSPAPPPKPVEPAFGPPDLDDDEGDAPPPRPEPVVAGPPAEDEDSLGDDALHERYEDIKRGEIHLTELQKMTMPQLIARRQGRKGSPSIPGSRSKT